MVGKAGTALEKYFWFRKSPLIFSVKQTRDTFLLIILATSGQNPLSLVKTQVAAGLVPMKPALGMLRLLGAALVGGQIQASQVMIHLQGLGVN